MGQFQEKNVKGDVIEGKVGKIYIPDQKVRDNCLFGLFITL